MKSSKFNKILSVLLLAGVVFSVVMVASAVAPDPGHNFAEIGGGIAKGQILYGSAADILAALPFGTGGQVLTASSTTGVPYWASPSGTSLTIGTTAIVGGGAGSILFHDAGNVLNEPANVDIVGGNLNITATTTPAAAPAGTVTIFGRSVANRMLPAIIGPSGLDTSLQPLLARNKIGYWNPQGNSTAVPGVFGFTAPTTLGTATARNVATTNFATYLKRLGYVTTTTAGTLAGQYTTVAQHAIGNGAGLGGFFYIIRFVPSDAATVSGERMFIGLSSSTGAPSNAEPSTLTNSVGVALLSTSTNLQIVYGGSVAQAAIDLGTGFPGNTLSTEAYELVLFSAPSSSNTVNYLVTRLSTGASASGTLTAATPGTQLPSATTLLAHRAWKTNNATALAAGLDIASIYLETDN